MLQPSGNTLNPLFSRASPCSENTFRIQLPVYHLGFLDRPCSFDIPRQDHTYTRLRFSFGGLQPGIYSCMEADQALHFITSLPELNGAALSKVQLAWAFDTTHCLTTDPVASHSPLLLFALCSLLSSLSSLLPALCSLLSALCSLCSLRSLPSPLCSLPFPSALSPLLSALCSLLSPFSFLLSLSLLHSPSHFGSWIFTTPTGLGARLSQGAAAAMRPTFSWAVVRGSGNRNCSWAGDSSRRRDWHHVAPPLSL